MSETPPTYDVNQAQAAIEADRQARAERAAQRIQEILDAEQCVLVAVPQFTADGRVTASVQIVTR